MSGLNIKERLNRHFNHVQSPAREFTADADDTLQLAPEDAYLSYHDVCLTREDVDCMRSDWLTDNVIAFWEEWLEHEELSKYPRANIVLLRPSMSFLLVQTPDPMTLKDALPSFRGTTHIFLPVNDCRSPNMPEGGSHWSLLLVSVVDGVAFHYDSLNHANQEFAWVAANKIGTLVGRPLQFRPIYDHPQQENGSDCGVFVCLTMKHLLVKRLLRIDATQKVSMTLDNKEVNAVQGRREMLRLVDEFRREGKIRSRSRSRSRDGRSGSRPPPRVGD